MNEPVVVPSAEPVSAFKELSQRDVGVCELSEIDIPVVEDSDSFRGVPEQEAASSKPIILLMMMDTETEVAVVSPERSSSWIMLFKLMLDQINVLITQEVFERKEREGKAYTVSEEVFVDDLIGS